MTVTHIRVEQKVNELRNYAKPSEVKVFDLEHHLIRTQPAVPFELIKKIKWGDRPLGTN